jgi:hypothetical protein
VKLQRFLLAFLTVLSPATVFAEWTPLITASDFTGINTDLLTTASGILGLVVIVLGIGILIRAMVR